MVLFDFVMLENVLIIGMFNRFVKWIVLCNVLLVFFVFVGFGEIGLLW